MGEVTARDRGLGHAMLILRNIPDPNDWKPELEKIKNDEERSVAREHLLGIYRRIQVSQETLARLAQRADKRYAQRRWGIDAEAPRVEAPADPY